MVMLVVIRVAVAIRGEVGVALVVLAACAWAVEICSENGAKLRRMRFRPTQASGILLGSLTPPLLMASRFGEVMGGQVGGLERGRWEFWSSIACSSALLILLMWSMVRRRERKHQIVQQKNGCSLKQDEMKALNSRVWGTQKSGAAIVFSLLAVMLLLRLGFAIGVWGVIWSFVSAAGSVFLFHYFLQAFPSCMSAGETMLVAHGLALCILNPLLQVFLNKVWHQLVPVENFGPVLPIVHVVVLGMLLVPVVYKCLLNVFSMDALGNSAKREPISESFPRTSLFCFTVLVMVIWVAPAWLRLVAGIEQHPVLWILLYLMDQPVQRLGLCVYWVFVIGLFSFLLHRMTVKEQMERIMIRKGFHIMAVVMFVPAVALQADFLRISFALALGVFILVEAIRVWRIPPLGEKIHIFLKSFTDSRDSDILIISHFSLLLGCAVPVWLSTTTSKDRQLAAYAGILSLGIGDTVASVVGFNFGSMQLNRWSKKTWEGTIAGILSLIVASALLSYVPPTFSWASQIGSIAIAATGAGLVEAFTSQLDNAFVPLIYYSLLSL